MAVLTQAYLQPFHAILISCPCPFKGQEGRPPGRAGRAQGPEAEHSPLTPDMMADQLHRLPLFPPSWTPVSRPGYAGNQPLVTNH